MAYQVTARKWRPQRFSDMVGQEHIARTLRNAIVTGRIAHAYLFVGPRGIGKTTSARIFAKALNCKHPIDGEPCCECSSCKAIADESSVDVIEIDAATHTQVEKARDICEDVLHLPIASKYKIYIIDEVHMLSKSAWNALLKTIEEPPAHAKFIFATTEVNKVLLTVISRCQRFDLCRIPSELIAKRLEYIASEEKIKISRSALDVIARAADGGMRDAQSLLDQLVSFFGTSAGDETISEEQALSLFGLTAPGEMEALLRSILTNDRAAAILSIHQFAGQGKNLETLFEEILTWLRGILLSLVLPDPRTVLDENPEKVNCYLKLASLIRADTLQILLEQLAGSSYLLREAINKQVFMETILLKAMRAAHAVKVEDLLIRLNQIRRNGELNGIEKIPSLSQVPVYQVNTPAVTPVAVPTPAPAPATEKPANEPIPQASSEPPSSAIAEPAVMPAEEPPAMKEPVVTEPAPSIPKEPIRQEEIKNDGMHNSFEKEDVKTVDEQMTESTETKMTEEEPSISESSGDVLPDDSGEGSETGSAPVSEIIPSALQPRDTMSLNERFSPEQLWKKLLDRIAKFQPSLSGILSGAFPDRIDHSMLYVLFDASDSAVSMPLVEQNKSLIVNELRALTGDTYADVSFAVKEGLRTQAAPKRSFEELKRAVGTNAMVQEAADLFSGVIVDVME